MKDRLSGKAVSIFRSYVCPIIAIGGFFFLWIAASELMMYGPFFSLSEDALPYTLIINIIVWIGVLGNSAKGRLIRMLLILSAALSSFILLFNIVGVLWRILSPQTIP